MDVIVQFGKSDNMGDIIALQNFLDPSDQQGEQNEGQHGHDNHNLNTISGFDALGCSIIGGCGVFGMADGIVWGDSMLMMAPPQALSAMTVRIAENFTRSLE